MLGGALLTDFLHTVLRTPDNQEVIVPNNTITAATINAAYENMRAARTAIDSRGGWQQDITWEELTKPYGHTRAGGRRHGPFDERTFGRAVTEGIDPAAEVADMLGVDPKLVVSDDKVALIRKQVRARCR